MLNYVFKFRDWTVLPKVMFAASMVVIIMAAAVFGYFIPLMQGRVQDARMSSAREVVEVVHGLLTHYNEQVHSGTLTLDEAKARSLEQIRALRYGGSGYFWINDTSLRMIMHPLHPELNGKSMEDFADPKGKFFFREMVAVAREKGDGFVEYLWPRPDGKDPVRKISCVKLFEPWGWIIGSGVYMDDVQADLNGIRLVSIGGMLAFALLTLTIAYFVARHITSRLTKIITGLREIAAGGENVDLSKRVAITSIDEIGILSNEFNRLMETLSQLTNFKKVIEEEATLEDVYLRLHDVFANELGLDECVFYEVNTAENRMRLAYPPTITTDTMLCEREILDACNLCKAQRTGHRVSSASFPNICRMFRDPAGRQHICLPLMISGGTIGVFQFLFPLFTAPHAGETADHLVSRAEQYLKESIPVIEAKRLLKSLHDSVVTDPLTGVHNRRFLEEYVVSLCAGAKRRGTTIGLLMCDLDFFKQVNDTYGHNIGDEVLMQAAIRIKGAIRQTDFVIRFGGEEFIVILVDVEPGQSMVVAEKIRATCGDTKFALPSGLLLAKT
ncbi:MAG: cache domain-containing protein, partial [Alphaproteobacteria bacterium]|nr:cache domain-containing protein [Alphaproteobacteria bacterium]